MKKQFHYYPAGATKAVWCTQYGEKIPVRGLDDEHLRNIVALLLRHSLKSKFRIAARMQLKGKRLQKFLAQPQVEFLGKFVPTFGALLDEIVKRRLTIEL